MAIMTTATKVKADVYEIVTNKIIEALEAGVVPWRRPWASLGLPISLSTGKHYRGINVWLLNLVAAERGYQSPYWGTYKQITERGGDLTGQNHANGTGSTLVILWKRYLAKVKNDETGEIELQPRFTLRYFNVFNVDQAKWPEGSKKPQTKVNDHTVEPDEAAEAIIKGYRNAPKIRHAGDQAYYLPNADVITVPPRDAFDNTSEYYSTLFHEVTHSTGHKDRLARPGTANFDHFGSERYSKEELVAEFGASFLCGVAGVDLPETLDNSAAYIGHWLGHLKDDHKLVVQAAAQAQHAVDYVLGTTFDDDHNEGE